MVVRFSYVVVDTAFLKCKLKWEVLDYKELERVKKVLNEFINYYQKP